MGGQLTNMPGRRAMASAGGLLIVAFISVHLSREVSVPPEQPRQPRVIVGTPQAGDTWPIDTAQVIRWAVSDLPVTPGKASSVKINVELLGEAGSQELEEDDGEVDLTFEQGDRILVARLRPPSFPATLESIRLLVPTVNGQSDRERDITLYFFADELGRGQPPDRSDFSTQAVRVRSTGTFQDFDIPSRPTLREKGDFYIGYEIRAPTGGFAFPIDTDSTQRRTFIAVSDEEAFREATFPTEAGPQVEGNLIIRAIVNVPATTTPLATEIDDTGEFCWRVTPPERQARIRVTALVDGEPVAAGESDPFTITEQLQEIRVTAPTGGEIWRIDEERLIQWEFRRLVDGVRIELLGFTDPTPGAPPDVVICLFDGVDITTGQKAWRVSAPRPGLYKIKVSSSLDPRFSDESDFFAILEPVDASAETMSLIEQMSRALRWEQSLDRSRSCIGCQMPTSSSTTSSPSITVVTPNGGEVFLVGDRTRIVWGSQGVDGPVNIVLYDLSVDPQNPQVIPLFDGPVENTGSIDWIVPARLSDAAKIGVLSADDPSIADVSDGVFTIGIPGQGSITILMPNGGEALETGSETRLLWMFEGSDIGRFLRLDISFDGGITYQVLDDEVENNGDYRLGLPFPPTDRVRLRLVSKRNRFISDVTNCSFRIVPPQPPDPNRPPCPPPPR